MPLWVLKSSTQRAGSRQARTCAAGGSSAHSRLITASIAHGVAHRASEEPVQGKQRQRPSPEDVMKFLHGWGPPGRELSPVTNFLEIAAGVLPSGCVPPGLQGVNNEQSELLV